MIKFDHIEVHVTDAKKYCSFLKKIFGSGRFKKIAPNNIYMFISADNFHIEIKEINNFNNKFDIKNDIGFCLPCLRFKGALKHLSKIKGIKLSNKLKNPDGYVYFFKDYEGIDWHIKDYDVLDKYVNI